MNILTTQGVKIAVLSKFKYVEHRKNFKKYWFSCQISIENTNDFPVQILERNLNVFSSDIKLTELSGKGIQGEFPEIKPYGVFTYDTMIFITAELGYAQGSYVAYNEQELTFFQVDTPRFPLVVSWKNN
jgi:ApaG protein